MGSLLEGVTRALQLDDAERDHLYDLARQAPAPAAARRRAPARSLRPALQHMLDAVSDAPAWIHNDRQDLLATNHLARALYAPLLADPRRPANAARFIYLDPAAHDFFPDCDSTAGGITAMLRAEAGRNPYDEASPTSSGNCPPAARSSADAGPTTKSATTAPAPRSSTTRSSETSNLTSKP